MVYDLDNDGTPEVVHLGTRRLAILDGRTGAEVWHVDTEQDSFDNHGVVLADFDDDGHVDILVNGSNRWNCDYGPGTGPVPCLGSTSVFRGPAHWAPGPKVYHQTQFRPTRSATPARSSTMARRAGRLPGAAAARHAGRPALAAGHELHLCDRRRHGRIRAGHRPRRDHARQPAAGDHLAAADRAAVGRALRAAGLPHRRVDPDAGDTLRYELVTTTHALGPGTGVNVDPATGVVDFYVGPCGSYGGPCVLPNVHVVVAAIDGEGARTEQGFIVDVGYLEVSVPDVVGQQEAAGIDTLTTAGMRPRVIERRHARRQWRARSWRSRRRGARPARRRARRRTSWCRPDRCRCRCRT